MSFQTWVQIAEQIDPLSTTRENLKNFVVTFINTNKAGPTLREIGKAVGLIENRKPLSKSVVSYMLEELEQDGLIELPENELGFRESGRIYLNEEVAQTTG